MATPALAEPPPPAADHRSTAISNAGIEVRRAPGVSCADEAALLARVAPLVTRNPRAAPIAVEVMIDRAGEALRANVKTSGSKTGERVLHGQSCAELEDSLTAALVLLLDDSEEAPASGPVRTLEMAEPSDEPARTAAAAAPPRRWPTWLSLGAGVTLETTPAPGWLGWFGIDSGWERVGFGLGVFATPAHSRQFGSGEVSVSSLGGMTWGCLAVLGSRAEDHASACALFALARLRGEATGYPLVTGAEHRPWYGPGLEVRALGGFLATVGFETALSVLVPLQRESFSIRQAGTAFRSPPVAVWLRAGPRFSVW